MPYVPSPAEAKRLRHALDRAAFSEAERIVWLLAFSTWLVLCFLVIAGSGSWQALGIGGLGMVGGFALLYWRLRGGWLSEEDRELHGIGLRTENQRAFTALMLRQALTGRNPLRPRTDHDPYAVWAQRVERSEAPAEVADEG
jgi:hypothetical protein